MKKLHLFDGVSYIEEYTLKSLLLNANIEKLAEQAELVELFKEQLDDFEAEATSEEDLARLAELREELAKIESKVNSTLSEASGLVGIEE